MAKIKSLNQQLIDAQSALSTATAEHRTASANASNYSREYSAAKARRDGGECANKHRLKSKRASCQEELNDLTSTALSNYNTWVSRRDAAKVKIEQAKKLIETLEEQIDSRIGNSTILAKQGLTSQAVETSAVITANAKAEAIKEQGTASSEAIKAKAIVDAEAQAESAETKNRLIMIVGIVVAVVLLAVGAVAIKKFKNKK